MRHRRDSSDRDRRHKKSKHRHRSRTRSRSRSRSRPKSHKHRKSEKHRKSTPHSSPARNSEVKSNVSTIENDPLKSSRKSSRWGGSTPQVIIPSHLSHDDAKVYSLQMQLNEINNKLTQKNYTTEYELMAKLPEPDPIYGGDGKRINTREYRARERLESRKKEIMIKLHEVRPDLVPNVDKYVSNRAVEKVFIPQEEYPDINFAGLIIGPRGMTQKDLEKETETKIILRGKGSVKVAKIAGTGQSLPGEDEPLHAYITATSREKVEFAAEKIRHIVQEAIEHPELDNELRKNQMKQLAIINGTYRETDGLNKLRMKEEISSIATNNIICSLCGGTGHLPRDCKVGNLSTITTEPVNADFRDPEYKEFLHSIGKTVESYEVEPTDDNSEPVSSFIKNFVFKT